MSHVTQTMDPNGLLEYSVVYTDRALNHMSARFQQVMKDISHTLQEVYNASAVTVVPGGGTFAMEAVARQFANNQRCLVIRNGWFSFRWSQIFAMTQLPSEEIVLQAQPYDSSSTPAFAPPPIAEVVAAIHREKPQVVFAAHVETSAGMILPDDYIRQLGQAVHEVGGMLVLDCIASGTIWVDMVKCEVDVLISAPQKGWTGSPCAGLVMLGPLAEQRLAETKSNSFACDLGKWRQIMQAYENGGHAYHATMPTDALLTFRDVMLEAKAIGFEVLKARQQDLGDRIRKLCSPLFKSVAASGFQAPSVVVSYTDNPSIHTGKAFAELGIQIAKGVPLRCNEPEGFQTFRIGLFGLDKLMNIDACVDRFASTLEQLGQKM